MPTTIFTENFETDGNGTRYTTSVPEFTDSLGDFFTRTDGSNIGTFYQVTGADGNFFFAAQDIDGEGAASQQTLSFSGIDITGFTNLGFSALFAEDDDGSNQDWDAADFFLVEYQIDGGGFQNLLAIENDGSTFNSAPLIDTDFDGTGDGTEITSTFAALGGAIAGTGSTLDLQFTFDLDSGDEDLAIDAIEITGDAATPSDVLNETFDDASQFTTSEPFFSDAGVSSGFDFFGISDGAGGGDFGGDPQPNVKAYTGFDGSFLTGMDLDGEGATVPVTVTWSSLDISGLSNLEFSGDFAEFFDSPGDIDAADSILVEYQIDGGGFQNLLAFEGADFSSTTFNGVFREDTDFDGEGDGTALGNAAQTFTKAISGTGSTLDLRLSVSVESGDEDFGVDNFVIAEASGGPSTTVAIAPDNAVQNEGNTGTTPFTFTVTRSGDTSGATSVDFAVSGDADAADFGGTLPTGTVNFADGETTQTITLDVSGDTDAELDENFTVTLSAPANGETITTATADGTIQNDDGVAITLISDIQGSGDASPLDGQIVTIEAVVTGDFQDGDADTLRNLEGFYVQEEDADADSNPLTSEGLFIFENGNFLTDVNVGDVVQITGTVGEAFGQTQLAVTSASDITVVSSGNTLPTAATVNFPVASVDDLEAFEGMQVTIPDTLFVTEYFNLDRFGEVVLSSNGASNAPGTDGRLDQFTQFNDPDVAGFAAYQEEIAKRRIVLDDGQTVQNPDPIIHGRGGNPLSSTNTLRGGDTVNNLSGVLGFGFGDYRIQPTAPVNFQATNPRPNTPEDVGGDLTVVSFNVLNFFTTLDEDGNPGSGPNSLSPRGADSQTEFDRQLEKLVTTLEIIDADIFGLIELENEFGSDQNGDGQFAIDTLVTALNNEVGAGTYAYADPGVPFVDTGDAISVGAIYKTSTIKIADNTTVEVLTDSDLPALGLSGTIFDGVNTNRAPLAVTFEEIATGEELTVAINHFKSKGGTGSGDDADAGDGQGNFNGTRLRGAEALDAWLDSNPTGTTDEDILIIGDLNAYVKEDPITFLEGEGYTNVVENPESAYSFVFDGQFGTLDHGLASTTLISQVTGATEWHVNADEPDALDYNLDFGRNPSLFDGTTPFRNSDHDPLIIGLDLAGGTPPTDGRTLVTVSGWEKGGIELGQWTNKADFAIDLEDGVTVASGIVANTLRGDDVINAQVSIGTAFLNEGTVNTARGADNLVGTVNGSGNDNTGFDNNGSLETVDGKDFIKGTVNLDGSGDNNTGFDNSGILLAGSSDDNVFGEVTIKQGDGTNNVGLRNSGTVTTNSGKDNVWGKVTVNGLGSDNIGLDNSGTITTDNGSDFVEGEVEGNGTGLRNTSSITMGNGKDTLTGLVKGVGVGIDNSGTIELGSGKDLVIGEGSDPLSGFTGSGIIDLGAGNDSIIGFGDQIVNGGSGNKDTAIFAFAFDGTITLGSSAANAIDITVDNVTMSFVDVERFDFAGTSFKINQLISQV